VHETGIRVLPLSIGRVPLTFHFSSPALEEKARERYLPFAESSPHGLPVFQHNEAPPPLAAWFDYALLGARLRLTREAAHIENAASEYTLDSLLRVLLSVALPWQDGFLLHAATVLREGRAFVFMGRSGVGKSTVARHAPAGCVLTDEISLVRRVDGCWHACGTPFWGEFRAAGQQKHAPVAGIYLLVQAARNCAERLAPAGALRALLPNVLFFSLEREQRQALLRVTSELAASLPVFRLEFTRDITFWEEIAP
jgi:hypothetical protein